MDIRENIALRETIAQRLYYMTYPGGDWNRVETYVRVHWGYQADKVLADIKEAGWKSPEEIARLLASMRQFE